MTCRGCGLVLTKRHQKVYCSNACQRTADRAVRVEAWLASGVGQRRRYADQEST